MDPMLNQFKVNHTMNYRPAVKRYTPYFSTIAADFVILVYFY